MTKTETHNMENEKSENIGTTAADAAVASEDKPKKPRKLRTKKEKTIDTAESAPEITVEVEATNTDETVPVIEDTAEVIEPNTQPEATPELELTKKQWFKNELLKGSYAIYQNGVLITTSANAEVIHIADAYFMVNNKKYAYNGIEIKR